MFTRIFKQTVRSAGANLTVKHLEEVSMSVLFLLDAARKADHTFGVPPPSTAHTIRDADKDILKMVDHLVEKAASLETPDHSGPAFSDPTETGWKKMTNTWLKETLERTSTEENLEAEREQGRELNIDYELSTIL